MTPGGFYLHFLNFFPFIVHANDHQAFLVSTHSKSAYNEIYEIKIKWFNRAACAWREDGAFRAVPRGAWPTSYRRE